VNVPQKRVAAIVTEYRVRSHADNIVTRLLEGIRTGTTPSPSLADGVQAQTVLDAVIESLRRGGWATVST